jgi:hypothetical protein
VNPYVETTDGLETMLQMGLKLPGSLPCSQKKKKKKRHPSFIINKMVTFKS